MIRYNLNELFLLAEEQRCSFLNEINLKLKDLTAEQRIRWGLKYLPEEIIITSSFGIQSIVSLHLVTCQFPDIPVILIDTGYLFPETYRFIDELTELLKLNLHVFRPIESPAWQEARYGRLWEKGIKGIKHYNYLNKVEPMKRSFKELQVNTWIAGLRRQQSDSRKDLLILSFQNRIFKLLPIVDWSNHQILKYIKHYSLVCHPLSKKDYLSVGDVHTTSKLVPGVSEEETRFFGLTRECGLHIEE
ncbi:phosphoadenylyl-sulfate reductase [Blochmannia endosymbiont of Colobopsis nipponica]|uniref:phosphoadenylyl-sulfate reductase n=1 Tax=Blochmannia endosymbiont of Colobopsis nipponica TaxID=2681987 RepID=UPI0017838C79|nr:phosphoadenylyl-sulfate reductase [Blochmannia endosymbiont of Colobopsis nipponica]QOI11247.1 phosphoadenylyl-sulfate reductase [Blochmannia endosymbiont of Colobopsis nipponica]